eukprot:gene5730-6430_t
MDENYGNNSVVVAGMEYRFNYDLSLHIAVLLLVLAVLIIASNLLVICAGLHNRRLHKLRYAPLLSLCIADTLMGVVPATVIVPVMYSTKTCVQILELAFIFTLFVHMASILNLVAVCVERWVAIFKPLQYGAFLKRRNIIILVLCPWLFALVLSILVAALPNSKISESGLSYEKIYIAALCATFFFFCFTVGYMQFKIIRVVKRHISRVAPKLETSAATTTIEASTSSCHGLGGTFNVSRRDSRRKEMATAVAVNLTYFSVVFTWTPCVILVVTKVLWNCFYGWQKGMQFSLFLIYLNCLINPLIYAIRIKDFRIAIVRMLARMPQYCQRPFRPGRLPQKGSHAASVINRLPGLPVILSLGTATDTLPVPIV